MKYNLIAVSGKKNSGKNTVCEIIKNFQSIEGRTYEIKAFADKLKESLAITWNISPAALDDRNFKESMHPVLGITWRELMQKYGEYMRSIDSDYWIKALFSGYAPEVIEGEDKVASYGGYYTSPSFKVYPNWLICDLRYKNEADYLRKEGALLIRVERFQKNDIVYWSDPDKSEFYEGASSGVYKIKKIYEDFCLISNDVGSESEVPYYEIKQYNPKVHISETDLDDYKFNEVIYNNGTLEDLVQKVKLIIEKYK